MHDLSNAFSVAIERGFNLLFFEWRVEDTGSRRDLLEEVFVTCSRDAEFFDECGVDIVEGKLAIVINGFACFFEALCGGMSRLKK
jgi:hypothetical protein